METKGSRKQSVVLVPAPFLGHITPMLQLGNILHSKGFSITVAYSEYSSPITTNHPEFDFVSLRDNTSVLLSGYDKTIGNMYTLLTTINNNCKAPLQDYLIQTMENEVVDDHGEKIACIIYDAIMYSADGVADQLKLPSIVMRPCNGAYVLSELTLLRLHAENCLPFTESQLQETIPELQPFKFKDMPFSLTSKIPETSIELWENITRKGSSRAIIWNTIMELEYPPLSKLQQHYQVPFFCMGPLHKIAPASQTSLLEEDDSCIPWLDKQPPNSVLYVSLGSLATMDEKELIETAYGLVKSDQSFLWVVRSDLVSSSKWLDELPEDFQKTMRERGRIVKWAPQKEILAHPAVGGFWSHCGWNSTLESICQGIPMICKPYFSDQMVNARYLTHVWKIGLEIDCALERGVIEKSVRRLMVDPGGKEMKKRVLDMKEKIEICMEKGGSSYKSVDGLTEFISSLSLNK